MQAQARPLQAGVRQTVLRPHVDHQVVGEARLGGAADQTFPEPVAAPSQLGPALLHRGERGHTPAAVCHETFTISVCDPQGLI